MEAVARTSGSTPEADEQRAQHAPLVLFPLKRQRKPERWQFIKLIPMDEFKDKPVHEFNSSMAKAAYCTECKLSIQYKSGQNNSVRLHMERIHSEAMSSFIKNKQPRQGRALHLDVRSSEEASTQTKCVTAEEQRKADRLLVIWVAKGMRPISIVDDPAFRAYVTYITRDLGGIEIKVLGRTELTHGIALLANEFRAKLMREMDNGCVHYCCTTDIWTDRAQRSFICLTLHYIDAQFERKNWTLEVKLLPGQHTGEAIAEALRDTLSEWGLKTDQCVALLRDGASNGVSAGNHLGVPHFSCVAHSLHLVLASALIRKRSRTSLPVDINAEDEDDASTIAVLQDSACDEVEHQLNQLASADERTTTDRIRSIVQVFRSMASYFHRSPKAKYRLSKLQAENELDLLEVVMDCPTRWNSCRDMLVRFVRIEASINLFFVHLKGTSGRREFPDARLSRPKPEEWFTIKCLTSLLDPIWGATELLSGDGYPTLGLALPCLRTIQSSLDNAAIFDDVVVLANNQPYVDETLGLMQNMRKTLSELFRVRFARSAFATDLKWVSLLDPRLSEMAHLDPDERASMRSVLVEVAMNAAQATTPTDVSRPVDILRSPPVATSEKVKRAARSNIFGSRVRHSMTRSTPFAGDSRAKIEQEVTRYLSESESCLDDDDPFIWWRVHEKRFPVLALVARKWLGCVATSVPFERAFSTSGNIVTARRCSLAPSLVRDLVFIAENCK